MNTITYITIFTIAGFLSAVFVNYKYNNIIYDSIYNTLEEVIKSIMNIKYDIHLIELKIRYLFDKYGKEKEFEIYIQKDNEELLESLKNNNEFKDNEEVSKIINDLINKKK